MAHFDTYRRREKGVVVRQSCTCFIYKEKCPRFESKAQILRPSDVILSEKTNYLDSNGA